MPLEPIDLKVLKYASLGQQKKDVKKCGKIKGQGVATL